MKIAGPVIDCMWSVVWLNVGGSFPVTVFKHMALFVMNIKLFKNEFYCSSFATVVFSYLVVIILPLPFIFNLVVKRKLLK